jgi:excinuclease UvrABC ATPase subunit
VIRIIFVGEKAIKITKARQHNLRVIKEADYIIDLGPEGGAAGGHICAQGNPYEILKQQGQSYTARFLRDYLACKSSDTTINSHCA